MKVRDEVGGTLESSGMGKIGIGSVLIDMYLSEINISLHSMWDTGWTVRIGDEYNGYSDEVTLLDLTDVIHWIIDAVCKGYPNSKFAKKYSEVG